MTTVLLPVKRFLHSKERLAPLLDSSQRAELARAMFEDVWATLFEAQKMPESFDQLVVVSAELFVLARCRKMNIPCLEEEEQISHSESVKRASGWAASLGATSLLSLAIDTPGATAEEIVYVSNLRKAFPVVVVPSADNSGTNALLRTPPEAIDPCFGPGSCNLHVEEAKKKGLPVLIFRSPGLATDIDTPEDLREFASKGPACRTRDLARQWLTVQGGVAACH